MENQPSVTDALRAAEAGANREPENPILLSTLSLILLWEGKGREALNHLLAIKAPRNSELGIEVTALKAYAYHLVGNHLRAQELYTEAAWSAPTAPPDLQTSGEPLLLPPLESTTAESTKMALCKTD